MRDHGVVLAVNVVAELHPDGPGQMTAIDKRPVEGRVRVHPLGLEGDRQMDTRHHGGPDQALYAYAREDLDEWQALLGRSLPHGAFGENVTLQGIDASGAVIGERWRIGEDTPEAVVVEVTQLRVPCATFARWMGEPRWVKRFAEHGRFGSYLRVVQTGTIAAGDEVVVIRRPSHGVQVGDAFRGFAPEQATALLAADERGEVELSNDIRHHVGGRVTSG